MIQQANIVFKLNFQWILYISPITIEESFNSNYFKYEITCAVL